MTTSDENSSKRGRKKKSYNDPKEIEKCAKAIHAVRTSENVLFVYNPNYGYCRSRLTINRAIYQYFQNCEDGDYCPSRNIDAIRRSITSKAPIENPIYGNFIHFKNGVLDLDTMEFKSGVPSSLIVNMIPHNYNPDASKVEWVDKVFNEWAYEDPVQVELMFAWIGYSMLEDNPFHKWMAITGARSSGKRCYWSILNGVVGNKNLAVSPLEKIGNASEINHYADKLILLGESNSSKPVPQKALSQLNEKDRYFDTRLKRQGSFSAQVITKMTFQVEMNFKVKNNIEPLKDNMLVLVFKNGISDPSKRDWSLREKFREEEAMGYIIARSVQALKKTLDRGYFILPHDSLVYLGEK